MMGGQCRHDIPPELGLDYESIVTESCKLSLWIVAVI